MEKHAHTHTHTPPERERPNNIILTVTAIISFTIRLLSLLHPFNTLPGQCCVVRREEQTHSPSLLTTPASPHPHHHIVLEFPQVTASLTAGLRNARLASVFSYLIFPRFLLESSRLTHQVPS